MSWAQASDLLRHRPRARSSLVGPPYVGVRGWLGVRIDNDPDWDGVAQIVEDANRMVAPKKLVTLLER